MFEFQQQNALLIVIVCFAMLFFAMSCDLTLNNPSKIDIPIHWITVANQIFPSEFVAAAADRTMLSSETFSCYQRNRDTIYLAIAHSDRLDVWLHELTHRWQTKQLHRWDSRSDDYTVELEKLQDNLKLGIEEEARLIEFIYLASLQAEVRFYDFVNNRGEVVDFYPYYYLALYYCKTHLNLYVTLPRFEE